MENAEGWRAVGATESVCPLVHLHRVFFKPDAVFEQKTEHERRRADPRREQQGGQRIQRGHIRHLLIGGCDDHPQHGQLPKSVHRIVFDGFKIHAHPSSGLDHANPHAEKHDQQHRQHRQTDARDARQHGQPHRHFDKGSPRTLDNEPAAENQAYDLFDFIPHRLHPVCL